MAKRASEISRFPEGFRILQGTREYITYIEHSSLRVWPSDVAAHYDSHLHSAVEIILPHRGEAIYVTEAGTYRVQPGEILIIPPECPHELTENSETLRYLLLFEPDPLFTLRDMPSTEAVLHQPLYLTVASPQLHEAQDLLSQVIEIYERKEPLWNSECYAVLLKLFVLLGREYLKTIKPAKTSRHMIDPVIMNSAVTYISEHYKEPISLNDVASFIGYSRCYFSRTFSKFAGSSFSEYLTAKRMNAAADMLLHTRKSIRSIAQDAGFGSVSSFNRIFQEYKNCSPTRFRALYGQKPGEEA